jgi:hypothetical protein
LAGFKVGGVAMTEEFQRRGHPELGFGYKPDLRHKLFGLAPRKDAASLLGSLPVPKTNGGLGEPAVKAMGIEDQLGAPYCVANAWAHAIRDCQQRNGLASPRLLSRLWLMFMMHAEEGDISGFDGAIVGDGADVLERMGFPPEEVFPYTDVNPNPSMQPPPADAVRQAYDRKAPFDYGRIMSSGPARVDDVLRALAWGGKDGKPCPVVFGSNVTNTFARNQLGPGFIVDAPTGDIDGGHAEEMIRFEFDPGVEGGVKFRVKNSWGPGWGDGGFWWMTPKYLMDPGTEDLWMADYQGVQP